MSNSNEIHFWDPNEENGWLSNFYPSKIVIFADGNSSHEFPTAEHYYQWMKIPHSFSRKKDAVKRASSPRKAKDLTHEYLRTIPTAKPDLELKCDLMREAIRMKFKQDTELCSRLVATNQRIVEASPTDRLWGSGEDGRGVNLMGMLLMELRASLTGRCGL